MSLNTSPINTAAFNASSPKYGRGQTGVSVSVVAYATGFPSTDVQQNIIYGQGAAEVSLIYTMYATGLPSVAIEQRVDYGVGSAEAEVTHITYAVGQVAIEAEQRVNHGTGTPVAHVLQTISPLVGYAATYVRQVVSRRGQASAQLTQEVRAPIGTASVGCTQEVFERGTGYAEVLHSVYEGAILGTTQSHVEWSVSASIGGTDVSALLTGTVRVEGEEGAARIAEFTYDPDAGVVDLMDWVGQPVTIVYAAGLTGTTKSSSAIFQGVVDVPVYDPVTQLVHVSATDNLQGRFEQATTAEIEEEVGGYWSRHVFSEDAVGWDLFLDRMSTQPASYDLDVNGSGVLTNWVGGASTDTYGEGDIDDESISFSFAGRRDILNTVHIGMDFRYDRLRSREVIAKWEYTGSWYTFLKDPWQLPTKEMLQAGIESSGWGIRTISFIDVPRAGYYEEGNSSSIPIYWGLAEYGASEAETRKYAIGVGARVQKRWVQAVTETYNISVIARASVDAVGTAAERESYGISVEQDNTEWEHGVEYLTQEDIPSSSSTAGVLVTESGDTVMDVDRAVVTEGRAEMENAQITAIAKASTAIQSSHRRNYVSFSTPMRPLVERHHVLSVDTPGVAATGKVFSFTHTLNVDTGEATTQLTLVLSRLSASGIQQESEILPIEKPSTLPTQPPAPPTPATLSMGTSLHVGSGDNSPVYQETWVGLLTNYIAPQGAYGKASMYPPPDKVYPFEFVYESPGIAEEDIQEVVGVAEEEIDVRVSSDALIITTT